jgi:hypothetical protein
MGWLQSPQQFDWLIGAVVGAVLGFVFGFFGRRLNAWRERGRRKDDLVRSLSSELRVNEQELGSAVAEGEQYRGGWGRPSDRQFTRDVYGACGAELALLPTETRDVVIAFYTCLNSLTSILREVDHWYHLDSSAQQMLYGRFMTTAREALSRAEKARSQLERLSGSRR